MRFNMSTIYEMYDEEKIIEDIKIFYTNEETIKQILGSEKENWTITEYKDAFGTIKDLVQKHNPIPTTQMLNLYERCKVTEASIKRNNEYYANQMKNAYGKGE